MKVDKDSKQHVSVQLIEKSVIKYLISILPDEARSLAKELTRSIVESSVAVDQPQSAVNT